jgi:hypothetical protein
VDNSQGVFDYIHTLWPNARHYFGDLTQEGNLTTKMKLISKIFSKIDEQNEQMIDEIFIDSANNELNRWELFVGLSTQNGQPVSNRQSRVLSKYRGAGTTTPALIKSVAEAYSNAEVRLIEFPTENRFVVKFVGARGVPPNIEDLKKILNEIKQAHIVMEFSYSYTLWSELKSTTWENVKGFNWNDVKTRRWS